MAYLARLVVFALVSVSTFADLKCFSSYDVSSNYYLNSTGIVVSETIERNLALCASKCQRDYRCVSANFADDEQCQLLTVNAESNLIHDVQWIHIELRWPETSLDNSIKPTLVEKAKRFISLGYNSVTDKYHRTSNMDEIISKWDALTFTSDNIVRYVTTTEPTTAPTTIQPTTTQPTTAPMSNMTLSNTTLSNMTEEVSNMTEEVSNSTQQFSSEADMHSPETSEVTTRPTTGPTPFESTTETPPDIYSFLYRESNITDAQISWNFDFSGTLLRVSDLVIDGTMYLHRGGNITYSVCDGNSSCIEGPGVDLETSVFAGANNLTLTFILSGEPDQYPILFPVSIYAPEDTFGFFVNITMTDDCQ